MSRKKSFEATVLASTTLSNGIYLGEYRITEILCPITASTSISFEVSDDGQNWFTYKTTANANILVTKTAGSASMHQINPSICAGFKYVRVRTGSTEGANRVFTLLATRD
jgi:hypothetical protein